MGKKARLSVSIFTNPFKMEKRKILAEFFIFIVLSNAGRTSVAETTTVSVLSSTTETATSAFKARAQLTKQQIEPLYRRQFPFSFITLIVIGFSNGSIITESTLVFNASASQPSNQEIVNTLSNNVQEVPLLQIDPISITSNDTVVTTTPPTAPTTAQTTAPTTTLTTANSGVRSHTSVLTAACLVTISLLLSYMW
ncbi:hypothetical protein MATL_G00221710 [Megalops atlanticus]|uniref:Uncharacterized protein n=1 Tax=Megalops atlanticus TaxID=7932 RepID=A0A9D3PG90_MEGAT|nr:hypothetical protein MATL_G00221710 [Megalops atlanticus]